jgi:hypothetical protein
VRSHVAIYWLEQEAGEIGQCQRLKYLSGSYRVDLQPRNRTNPRVLVEVSAHLSRDGVWLRQVSVQEDFFDAG